MKDSIETLKKIYKPYKYTILNKCTLLESTSGNIVIKEKGKTNLRELFSYLKSRNFTCFPKLIEENREEVNVFEYVDNIEIPVAQKANDLMKVVASLHEKTSYNKEVTDDKYKEIYENVLSNIHYKRSVYSDLISFSEDSLFPSPSEQLLLINSNKMFEALDFCERELESWLEMVLEKKKQKVSLIHNNLRLEHYLKSNNDCLISWDNACVDTPVIDLVTLYRNDALNIDFRESLDTYLKYHALSDDELKLFFILIVIPDEINLNNEEIRNVKNVRHVIDYIFKTEDLIRPYYSKEKEE